MMVKKPSKRMIAVKKYILGALIGFTLSLGVGAHAEVVNMIGKVIDGSFPVKVNGKNLQNSAIVVEGTSYLPVREFGESLGMDIKFDSTMGIELTQTASPETISPKPTENPKMKRLKAINDEMSKLLSEIRELGFEINKADFVDENGDHVKVDNLEFYKQQLSEKQAQLDELVQERNTLQAE